MAKNSSASLKRQPETGGPVRGAASPSRPPLRRRILSWTIAGAILVAAPFVVLIRGAVWLYADHGFSPWIALGVAVVATSALLMGYAAALTRRMSGSWSWSIWSRRVIAALVASYAVYAVAYLAADHAKSDEVRSQYHALHPLLRVAASTLILMDPEAVVTDLARHPADYSRMGLPIERSSSHYIQADGYSHALDLRTVGRPWWRNIGAEVYFRVMGFETLRHAGTADHLHVYLP